MATVRKHVSNILVEYASILVTNACILLRKRTIQSEKILVLARYARPPSTLLSSFD